MTRDIIDTDGLIRRNGIFSIYLIILIYCLLMCRSGLPTGLNHNLITSFPSQKSNKLDLHIHHVLVTNTFLALINVEIENIVIKCYRYSSDLELELE